MVKTLFVILILLSIKGISQDNARVLYADANVEVAAVLQNCERKDKGTHIQYYYLKVSNLTENELSISFKREMWYNNKCTTCDKETPEYIFKDNLLPNSSKIGDCYKNTDRQYRIFSKMLNFESKSILTDFRVINVKTEKL